MAASGRRRRRDGLVVVLAQVVHAPGERDDGDARVAQPQEGPPQSGRPVVVQEVLPPAGNHQLRDDHGHLPVRVLLLEVGHGPAAAGLASRLRDDPAAVFAPLHGEGGGPAVADAWQADLLRGHLEDPRQKSLVCCARQLGKSQTAAGLALVAALTRPEATVLVISRSLRQSAEVLRKVRQLYWGLQGERAPQRGRRPWVPLPLREWQKREARYEARSVRSGEEIALPSVPLQFS